MTYNQYQRAYRHAYPLAGLLDELVDGSLGALASAAGSVTFKMDVEETADGYVVTAELPGVSRDEIDVELNEGRLSISVNKTEAEDVKDRTYLVKETGAWSASRGIYLKDAAIAGLSAKLENGLLTVNVPKQEEKVNVTKVTID